MATLAEKIACERDARAMLEREGLPAPDRVEYGHTCIRLLWHQAKVCLTIDIDEPPEGGEFSEESDEEFREALFESDIDELGY